MVASTERVYTAVHRKLLMAMTNHIQGALTKLLHSWEQDETGSYKDSFIMSDACQHHVDNDHVSDVYSCNNLDLQIESAQAAKEAAEASLRRESLQIGRAHV